MVDDATAGAEARTTPEASWRAAFARMADGHLLRAYRPAAILLGSGLEAQDAVQDASVAAWRSFPELRDAERFDAWFDRILVNTCRDRLRRRGRVRQIGIDAAPEPSVADRAEAIAERDALRAALAALPDAQRVVVVLRYFDDLPLEEIAKRTGERVGTVKHGFDAPRDEQIADREPGQPADRSASMLGTLAVALGALLVGSVALVSLAFNGRLDTTVLGIYLATQVRPFHLAIGGLTLGVGALAAGEIVSFGYLRREAAFATLRAIGWSPALVVRFLVTQALVLGLLGGVAGAAGILLVAQVLHASSGAAELGAWIALGVSLVAAAAAAVGPALLALRAVPATILRGE